MHEKLIAELEEMGKIAQNNRLMNWESIYLSEAAAAALREDAGTIAELTETLAVRDRQMSDANIETTSLRANLEKCEEVKEYLESLGTERVSSVHVVGLLRNALEGGE